MRQSWESEDCAHFDATDFRVVLHRCAKWGVGVIRVEAFTREGLLLAVNIPGSPGSVSHDEFVRLLAGSSTASFCATYSVHSAFSASSARSQQPQETMDTVLPSTLIKAYQCTNYSVRDGSDNFVLRIDVISNSLENLYQRNGVGSAVFVTAFNPLGEQTEEAQNLAAHETLGTRLRSLTSHVFAGIGEDPSGEWPGEPSWLALGIDLATSRQLGRDYGQNAVVWCNSDAIPKLILLR